jgi:hypothetical protein
MEKVRLPNVSSPSITSLGDILNARQISLRVLTDAVAGFVNVMNGRGTCHGQHDGVKILEEGGQAEVGWAGGS